MPRRPKPHKLDRDEAEQEKVEHPYVLKRFGLESKYSGESRRGTRHGQGREEWENGIVCNGSWDQGLKMGLGVCFDPNTNRRDPDHAAGTERGVLVEGLHRRARHHDLPQPGLRLHPDVHDKRG